MSKPRNHAIDVVRGLAILIMAVMFGGAMSGGILARCGEPLGYARLGVAAVGLVLSGASLWVLFPGLHVVRAGYSEMFYPPTVGFVMVGLGLMLALLWLVHGSADTSFYAPVRWLGQASLAMYILHFVLIRFVVTPAFAEKPLPVFLGISTGTTLILVLVALGLRELKKRWPDRPYPIRFLLGG